jgi:ribonuclease T1
MSSSRPRWWTAVVAVVMVALAACAGSSTPASSSAASSTPASSSAGSGTTAPPTTVAVAPTVTAPAGMRTVAVDALPPEARTTLRRIDSGGPFPYTKDGATFENRERRLPAKPSGYYREYTVETPGSPDRGARRIVAGRSGERYYTADHYGSFRLVVPA